MSNKAFSVMMAVIWGIVFTYALHSMALGICMGLMMASVFGLYDEGRNNSSRKNKGKRIEKSGRDRPE